MAQTYATPAPQEVTSTQSEPMSYATDDQTLIGNEAVQQMLLEDAESAQSTDPYGECLDPSFAPQDLFCAAEVSPEQAPLLAAAPELDEAQKSDRAQCAVELRDKFVVVPDDFNGLRDPNTLTESEYAQTVAVYSDIKLGRSDLKIAPGDTLTPEQQKEFERGTLDDLSTMMQTEAGRAVIGRLHDNTAGEEKDEHGNPVHHTTTIKPGSQENPHSDVVPGEAANAANGMGADVVTEYMPGLPAFPPFATEDQWAKRGVRSDVTLFHELTHAVHQTEGRFNPGNVPMENRVPGEGTGRITWDEYSTVGLNGYYNLTDGVVTTETAYRDERAQIMQGGRAGDEDMPFRDRYQPRRSPGGP